MDHHGLPTPRTTLAASYVVCWCGAKVAAAIRRPPTCRSSWRRAEETCRWSIWSIAARAAAAGSSTSTARRAMAGGRHGNTMARC